MRPYWAIIWDSFYQALVSWLLWIVLGATALVLLAFAGLTYQNELNTKLRFEDVSDWRALARRLVNDSQRSSPSPGKHLYEQLARDIRRSADILARPPEAKTKPMEEFVLAAALSEELSRNMARDDFYDPASFKDVKVSAEGRELIAGSELTEQEIARRNRLLFEAAYPEWVKPSERYGVRFYYLNYAPTEAVPLSPEQINDSITSLVTGMLVVFVSTIGMMVAIVLTSWLMPLMFEEGSIVVLLSKPVSRSLLFLSKFLGACTFTLITTAFFVIGLYFIVGLRLGVWLPNILWCIPIFVFVFAVYYSVSAVCGLMSRSTMVGTVFTIVGVLLFWAFCFGLGFTKSRMENFFLRPTRIVKLVPAGEQLFAATEKGHIQKWNSAQREWQDVLVNKDDPLAQMPLFMQPPRDVLGPVYDIENNRLLSLNDGPPPGMPFLAPEQRLAVGSEAQNFRYTQGASTPNGMIGLFVDREGKVLLVSRTGVQRLAEAGLPAANSSILRSLLALGNTKGPLESIGPEGLFLRTPASVTLNKETGDLAIYSNGTLIVLRRTAAGKYERGPEIKLAGDPKPGLVAFGGSTILLALSDGSLTSYNAATLEGITSWEPAGKNKPRAVIAAANGKWFAALYHNGQVFCLDVAVDELIEPNLSGQGSISAVAFGSAGELLVVDRETQVTSYEPGTWNRENQFAPDLSLVEKIYHWGVVPAYYCLPKPGELDNTASYLITRKETKSNVAQADDLRAAEVKHDPWSPVWSSAAFIVVMLAYGCWKIERMEF